MNCDVTRWPISWPGSMRVLGSVALALWGAVSTHVVQSSSDREDIEQLVDEPHLVLDVWLTGEAMAPADHPHDLESLDGSGSGLHRLKTSGGSNDLLESTVVCRERQTTCFTITEMEPSQMSV